MRKTLVENVDALVKKYWFQNSEIMKVRVWNQGFCQIS